MDWKIENEKVDVDEENDGRKEEEEHYKNTKFCYAVGPRF